MKKIYKCLCLIMFIAIAYLFIKSFLLATGLKESEKIETYVETNNAISENAVYTISFETNIAIEQIPLEEFLIGVLAANISKEYELEALKAQAIILRGNCYLKCLENPNITREELGYTYISTKEMELIWGGQYEEYYQKFRQAVEDTKGIVVANNGQPISLSYHAMSSGKTRKIEENITTKTVVYKSVACPNNVESNDYLGTIKVKLNTINEFVINKRDSAGYVTEVTFNGSIKTGEEIRKLLGLASANFDISKEGNYLIVVTKGMGHGFGFDQYYGNYLAKAEGLSYMEILNYFFNQLEFIKINL